MANKITVGPPAPWEDEFHEEYRKYKELHTSAKMAGDALTADKLQHMMRELATQKYLYNPRMELNPPMPVPPMPGPLPVDHPTTLRKNILMRLRVVTLPFKWWEVRKANDNLVVLFIIHNDKWIALEDEWNLFPSDQLISQLRLLVG